MMSLIRPKTTPVRDQKQLYNAVRLSLLLQITTELPDQLLCNQPCLPSSAHDSKRHGTPGVLPRNIGNLVVVNAAKGYEVLGSAQPTLAPPVTSLCIAPHRITSCVCGSSVCAPGVRPPYQVPVPAPSIPGVPGPSFLGKRVRGATHFRRVQAQPQRGPEVQRPRRPRNSEYECPPVAVAIRQHGYVRSVVTSPS